MNEQWFRDYIQLAWRIDKIFQARVGLQFVDYYYGPAEWKNQVQVEPEQEPGALVQAATNLLNTLSTQGFDQHRTTYLRKQVMAMETIGHKLNGESFALAEEMQRLYDIPFAWTPEEQFAQALALYDEHLPGKGPIATRLHEWRKRYRLPWEKRAELPMIAEQMLAEIRRRTLAFLDLPAEEGIDLHMEMSGDPFGGACWYKGNYRSHVEVNLDSYLETQASVHVLIDTLCHEVYPGHHVTYSLRDQQLYREKGYLEETIGLIFAPIALINEGIANHALTMLFSPGELEEWLSAHIYPELGIEPARADVEKIQHAATLLEGVFGNAIWLLREEKSDDVVLEYLAKYMKRGNIEFWKKPFHECFGIVEPYGKRLLHATLQGADRHQVFRRYLTEQWYPSELAKRRQGGVLG